MALFLIDLQDTTRLVTPRSTATISSWRQGVVSLPATLPYNVSQLAEYNYAGTFLVFHVIGLTTAKQCATEIGAEQDLRPSRG